MAKDIDYTTAADQRTRVFINQTPMKHKARTLVRYHMSVMVMIKDMDALLNAGDRAEVCDWFLKGQRGDVDDCIEYIMTRILDVQASMFGKTLLDVKPE